MSNDALIGYMAGKAVMDKVNDDLHNQREINNARGDAALANQRASSAKETTASVVGVVIGLKKQLHEAREISKSWKTSAFRERTGKLAWIRVVKDLIKYKHVDKTYEELESHCVKYYNENLEDNYKLMENNKAQSSDVKLNGDFPLL